MDNEDQHTVRGAQLLLAGAILQQYCTVGEEEGDESEDGSDAIDVRLRRHLRSFLFTTFSHQQATVNAVTQLFPVKTSEKDKNKKKRKSVEPQPEDGGEPLPIDILADALIGFLEKGTMFLRTAANQSFSLLSARLRRSTIELILTVGATPSCKVKVSGSTYDAATGTKRPHSRG